MKFKFFFVLLGKLFQEDYAAKKKLIISDCNPYAIPSF